MTEDVIEETEKKIRVETDAIHALLLDPLCAAACSLAEIKAMTLELFEAERDYLPDYK